jgi:hypothetical protein
MDPGPFARLLADLTRAEVRYLVVGGVACAFNGFARTTEDVDLLIDADPANVRRLLGVLESIGDGHARELRVEDFGDEEGSVRLIEEFPIDIFTRMGGRRYVDMLRYRKVFHGAADIPYVDAEGLILLKAGSRRERDRIDVEALKRLLERG